MIEQSCMSLGNLRLKAAVIKYYVSPAISQSPFSVLNLSHASFSVANTAALIIFCSVVAVVGS